MSSGAAACGMPKKLAGSCDRVEREEGFISFVLTKTSYKHDREALMACAAVCVQQSRNA